MTEYRVTEKQLEKLSLYLEELSGIHEDMGNYDICVNPRDLENTKGKLSETIRELKYLIEDIEGQGVETGKRPVTLLEVVGASFIAIGECPWEIRFSDVFGTAGYKQPDTNCPRGADGNHLSCTDCWKRPAEPLEESDHAR